MLELEHGFRVVDTHVELEPDETRRPRGMCGPEQVDRELHQAGIVEALAVPATRAEYTSANNAIARIAVDRPLVAAARITGVRDPGTGPTARVRNVTRSRADYHTDPEEIEQYAYEDRFTAFPTPRFSTRSRRWTCRCSPTAGGGSHPSASSARS